jgi:hypothetical protein
MRIARPVKPRLKKARAVGRCQLRLQRAINSTKASMPGGARAKRKGRRAVVEWSMLPLILGKVKRKVMAK